jgi:uncharacterized membrane protein YhiD involved in acid resistance
MVMKNQPLRLVVVFLLVLFGSALLVYLLLRSTTQAPQQERVATSPADSQSSRTTPAPSNPNTPVSEVRQPASGDSNSFIDRLFESKTAEETYASQGLGPAILTITLRLLLATALGAVLAFRPRKKIFVLRRNPYVAQTQILLAIVASALMMIVGDNAARAFGIFAAVSLVRFRTNIRDPKEISVLLISLGLGLACGVGRPELAVVLCVFSLIVLRVLENFESRLAIRSMQLKILTKDIAATQQSLRAVLDKHQFESEIRALKRDGDNGTGTLATSVDISPEITTDQLSQEILTGDRENITSIEWEQEKSTSYLYQ